jgi:opacity protein-like surface antigen
MKNSTQLALGLLVAVSMAASNPASAAVELVGVNGWKLSTDGIVDLYSTYASTTKDPGGAGRSLSLLSVGGTQAKQDERFGMGIGLLPSVIAFNVTAPTINGVDSSVRVGIYPALQNKANATGTANRFDTSPNIDFREFFYTAKGAYGELLVGRALNLFQGKSILNDMTLLGAGVVPGAAFRGNTTLGHIGYGYLYTNFGPQIRYTTPDFSGTKVAFSIGEPYAISADTNKTKTPRLETEISYAKTYGGTIVQAWASGLYQSATRSDTAAARPGRDNQSIGGSAGASAALKNGLSFMASSYVGKGLGMVSVQDGDFLGSTATDAAGNERTAWGYLAQVTYALTPSVTLGVNYGQSREEASSAADTLLITNQEAATTSVTYALNKFIKFTGEYTYAQNVWNDHATQHSNQFALGSTFFW